MQQAANSVATQFPNVSHVPIILFAKLALMVILSIPTLSSATCVQCSDVSLAMRLTTVLIAKLAFIK
jgi:hypothetical protein